MGQNKKVSCVYDEDDVDELLMYSLKIGEIPSLRVSPYEKWDFFLYVRGHKGEVEAPGTAVQLVLVHVVWIHGCNDQVYHLIVVDRELRTLRDFRTGIDVFPVEFERELLKDIEALLTDAKNAVAASAFLEKAKAKWLLEHKAEIEAEEAELSALLNEVIADSEQKAGETRNM